MRENIAEDTLVGYAGANDLKRISWGAVFAGLAVTLVTQFTLTILGIGIGAAVVNFQDNNPETGAKIGGVIWFLASNLISLYLGGCVAGRLAGSPRKQDAWLHGLVTWSSYTLVMLLLLGTTVGGILGGVSNVLGKSLQAAGPAVSKAIPEAMGRASDTAESNSGGGQSAPNNQNSQAQIDQEIQSIIQQKNPDQSQPADAERLKQAAREAFASGGQNVSPQSRDALIDALAKFTGMPRQEAEQKVAGWQQSFQQKFGSPEAREATAQRAKERAKEMANTAAEGVSKAALWTFFTLVLGAAACAIGGISARPKRQVIVDTNPPIAP